MTANYKENEEYLRRLVAMIRLNQDRLIEISSEQTELELERVEVSRRLNLFEEKLASAMISVKVLS